MGRVADRIVQAKKEKELEQQQEKEELQAIQAARACVKRIRSHAIDFALFDEGHKTLKKVIEDFCLLEEEVHAQKLLALFVLNPFGSRLRFLYVLDNGEKVIKKTNLFGLCIGKSGAGKSTAIAPIQRALTNAWSTALLKYDAVAGISNIKMVMGKVIEHTSDYRRAYESTLSKKFATEEDANLDYFLSWLSHQKFVGSLGDSSSSALHMIASANRSACLLCNELRYVCKQKGDSRALEMVMWYDGDGFEPSYKYGAPRSKDGCCSIFFNTTKEWLKKSIDDEGDSEGGFVQRMIFCTNRTEISYKQNLQVKDRDFVENFPREWESHLVAFWDSFITRPLTDFEFIHISKEMSMFIGESIVNVLGDFFLSFDSCSAHFDSIILRWRSSMYVIVCLVCFYSDRNLGRNSGFTVIKEDVLVAREICFQLFRESALVLQERAGDTDNAKMGNRGYSESSIHAHFERFFKPNKTGKGRRVNFSGFSIEAIARKILCTPSVTVDTLVGKTKTDCIRLLLKEMLRMGLLDEYNITE